MNIHNFTQMRARRGFLLLTIPVIGLLLSGCAWTKTPANISLSPKQSVPLNSPAKATLRVTEVKDTRSISDPTVIVQKRNAYGKTTGAYVAERPVKEIFHAALEATLRTNAFNLSSANSDYELKAEIKGIEDDFIQTGLFTAEGIFTVTVRFELLETSSGNLVWHDTLSGKAKETTSSGSVAFIKRNVEAAADDVIRQLIADKQLRRSFQ